jgi:hypothetical protein
MPSTLLDRLITVVVICAGILTAPTASEAADGDLRKIDELCVAAKRDRDLGNYEEVERGRRKRWELIEGLADSGHAAEGPWLIGFLAIRDVDGDENTAAENLKDPGMVNRLKYKEACARLRDAWNQMTRATDGPVLGEVAVRLFEVAQQSRGVYRDALDQNSSNCVATVAELKSVLAEAEKRDPFCIMATPLLHFLDTPDDNEAFLRAEHRKSFQQRQSALVAISHPAVFLNEKTQEVQAKRDALSNAVAEGNPGELPKVKISENADKPLLPWHAAVELDKATSLQHLLEELDYGTYLKPDLPGLGYILPGKFVAGRDRMSDRFVLLYGRYLFCRVEDSKGALRAAVLYLDEDHKWQCRYLNLLWRTPQKDEQHPLRELVEALPARHEFKLADHVYTLRDFPIEECEDLIAAQTQVVCVKDAKQLARLRYHPTKNDVNAIIRLLSLRKKDPNDVQTTPEVAVVLQDLLSVRDNTKHPLIELMSDKGWPLQYEGVTPFVRVFNPLVVVSDGDNAPVVPHFFAENTPAPYLQLEDGHKLVFELSEGDGSPRCCIRYPGATVSMPLHFHSVPKNLLKGGRMGAAFFRLLTDAGYTEPQSFNEIQACIEDPEHIPDLFRRRLRAKAVSTRSDSFDSAMREMLQEAGWSGEPVLVREMSRLYGTYGFRYLRDQRGNWITSRRFSDDQGLLLTSRGAESLATSGTDALPPFDFRAQDGSTRIDTTQIYSMEDYKQIKRNILNEHLNKLIRFHPAVPVVDAVRADAEKVLDDPTDFTLALSDVIEEKLKKAEAFKSSIAAASEGLASDSERLYAPVAAWSTNDDKLQAHTLDSLHNAYVTRVKEFALESYKMQLYPMAYDILAELTKVCGSKPSLMARIKEIRQDLDSAFNSQQQDWLSGSRPVLATQLETARFFARSRLHHKALLHYNDLLQQMFLPQYRREGHDLFQKVVTSEEAQKFGDGIEKVIRNQQMVLTAQMELAGVLNAAGLKDSAYFVWQRVADDERYLLQPTAEIVQDIIESYGLRTSDRVSAALSGYRASALLAEQAIKMHCTAPPWRACVDLDLAKKKELSAAIAVIKTHASSFQPQGKLGVDAQIKPEEERQYDRALERVDAAEALDFDTWLRYRQALLPRGEVFALRTRGNREDYLIHPAQFCPRSYSRDVGFIRPFSGMLVDTSPAEIRDWCGLNEKEAIGSEIAEKACFLLGWYWLDEGQKSKARAAFMKLADILLARSEKALEPEEKLTKKLSALAAILGGYAIIDEVPGVKVIRSGLGAYMVPQLVHLERQWFSAGQYGPHAASECRILERHVEAIQDRAMQIGVADRTDRYFLADYTYMYGAVPDWLVVQAITSPELFFDNLTEEKIAELKANAVEGKRWVLLDEKDAEHFFKNLKLDTSVHEDIVNLAK